MSVHGPRWRQDRYRALLRAEGFLPESPVAPTEHQQPSNPASGGRPFPFLRIWSGKALASPGGGGVEAGKSPRMGLARGGGGRMRTIMMQEAQEQDEEEEQKDGEATGEWPDW